MASVGSACQKPRPTPDGAASVAPVVSAAQAADFPAAGLDLPADRLHERVDGAEPLLQRLGCRRLLYWRLEDPGVDVEVEAFRSVAGARAALEKDAGKDRTAGTPGEEGWSNTQVVFFRRGTSYVRVIADPPATGNTAANVAGRFDHALRNGTLRP